MQNIFRRLQPENVTITYQREANLNNLGYNESGWVSHEVTVSITGMTHQFYFIGRFSKFFWRSYYVNAGNPEYRLRSPARICAATSTTGPALTDQTSVFM